jgi:UDP-N-acetylglucosamine acyltransferase
MVERNPMPIAASARVHPTAIVDPLSEIGDNVQIGPYVVIEGPVRIGADCVVRSHACLIGPLTLGRGNDVGISVILGERPQHLGYKNEETRTEIGDFNIFREHATVHRGTAATGVTTIGNNNYLMAHSHVAHDCRVGNHTMIVHGSLLGGHCILEDRALLAGNAAIHQFTRMGRLSLLSGLSSITMDLPPFMMAWGRNNVIGINKIGMRRAGMNLSEIRTAQQVFQILYRSDLMQKLAVQKLEQELGGHSVGAEVLAFIRNSKRGIIGPKVGDDREMAEAA